MKKVVKAAYIDYANKEQVEWWNAIGGRLVKAHTINEVVETATNKPVGVIIGVTGLFARFVIDTLNSYHHEELTEMEL